MKRAKIRCPYFILLILTSALFGCILANHASVETEGQKENTRDNTVSESSVSEKDVLENSVSQNGMPENDVSGNDKIKELVSQNSVSGNDVKKVLDTEEKIQEYLEGTLFIGDSRTATLQEYAGWDDAAFYVKYGLTIWDVLDEKLAAYGEKKITVDEALQKEKFERIYIMLGINELGRGTPETFSAQYEKVIERIKQLQPDAAIILEAIMHVTEEKDAEGTYINNTEINIRNEKLKQMAAKEDIYWMDVNQVTDDAESHCLVSDYSFDGVHLKVKYLDIWKKFLLENPY